MWKRKSFFKTLSSIFCLVIGELISITFSFSSNMSDFISALFILPNTWCCYLKKFPLANSEVHFALHSTSSWSGSCWLQCCQWWRDANRRWWCDISNAKARMWRAPAAGVRTPGHQKLRLWFSRGPAGRGLPHSCSALHQKRAVDVNNSSTFQNVYWDTV